MLCRIVERDSAIEMRSPLSDVSRIRQGNSHQAMPDHERDSCPFLLRQRQELHRKLAQSVAIKRRDVRDPDAVEDREQQQTRPCMVCNFLAGPQWRRQVDDYILVSARPVAIVSQAAVRTLSLPANY